MIKKWSWKFSTYRARPTMPPTYWMKTKAHGSLIPPDLRGLSLNSQKKPDQCIESHIEELCYNPSAGQQRWRNKISHIAVHSFGHATGKSAGSNWWQRPDKYMGWCHTRTIRNRPRMDTDENFGWTTVQRSVVWHNTHRSDHRRHQQQQPETKHSETIKRHDKEIHSHPSHQRYKAKWFVNRILLFFILFYE